jgi:hypothetical protein
MVVIEAKNEVDAYDDYPEFKPIEGTYLQAEIELNSDGGASHGFSPIITPTNKRQQSMIL